MPDGQITRILVAATSPIGAGTRRVDGPAKVTGAARYAAEFAPPGLAHAVLVQSTVPAGCVTVIDTAQAAQMPGVLAVLTHHNAPRLAAARMFPAGGASQSLLPLQDDRVRFTGQPVGLVVAETFEQATDAADQVKIGYKSAPFVAEAADPAAQSVSADELGQRGDLTAQGAQLAQIVGANEIVRGDPDHALASAPVTVDAVYSSPREYHVTMEPHATVAHWSPDGMLTVWEPSQWVMGARAAFADWFELPVDKIRVISPYIGGGFGSKAGVHPHAALAAMAAREVGRPVKLVLARPQSFAGVPPRPAIHQHLLLGADTDGRLRVLIHEGTNETSVDDIYFEPVGDVSRYTYAVPNLRTTHRVVRVNAVTPTWMRAPGEAMGTFALESAMDELAEAVGQDPVELRLRNYAVQDPESGKPWSMRALREAFAEGADAFGWQRRDPRPRSMRAGRDLVGWGVAGGTYPRYWLPAEARVRVRADGAVEVESSGVDLGTGTYTVLTQVAADALRVPTDRVAVRLGDTAFPSAPVAGGSSLTGALAPVAHEAASTVRDELIRLAASDPASPLHGAPAAELVVECGRVALARDRQRGMSFADILRRAGRDAVEAVRDSMPPGSSEQDRQDAFGTVTHLQGPTAGSHSIHAWSALFVEVRVDQDLGTLRVARMVGAFDCGRVLNPATTRSQLIGGMVMGVGAACLEAARVDRRNARIVNANLAEYMIPVNADIPDIEILFVGEPDPYANPLGTKPVGELGITGVAAAIANAVYHATGRRVRDLPILMEKLL
jgi:xanthine dehydrogenase YagR molybdenum-binding subunit